MSDLILGPFKRLYSGYESYVEKNAVYTVISNPKAKVAQHAIKAVDKNLQAAKDAYEAEKARMEKYENAINLVKDSKKIEGYLKIFSAIEASSSSTTVNSKNKNITGQLHHKKLSELDAKVLNKKDENEKLLRDVLNEFLTPLETETTTEETSVQTSKETNKPDDSGDALIKRIKSSLPSHKREKVDKFNDLVAKLEAACFGFAGRYGLFNQLQYNPSESTHKPAPAGDSQLERYSLIAFYEEAVDFLRTISPRYYKREFHIVPSLSEQKIENIKSKHLKNSSPELNSKTLEVATPSTPLNKKLLSLKPSMKTLPISPMNGNSTEEINQQQEPSDNIAENTEKLERRIHAYLKSNGATYDESKTNYCPEFENLKKLILYYKQQQKLMPHEKIPLVDGHYIQEQTKARIDLSLYDYHTIMKMIVDTNEYGPLVTNLLESHRELLKDLDDTDGTLKLKSGNKAPQLDPWMNDFVKLVLRNRMPLKLYVLFPDLAQELQKSFISMRIGATIGVKENPTLAENENPILLTDEEAIIRCSDPTQADAYYKVEFKINGNWFDISDTVKRNTSIKTLLEEGTNSTLSQDITFDGILKQFKARSPKGWQHFDIIHGQGLQIYHKHYQVTSEVKPEERGADGALKGPLKDKFKPFAINPSVTEFDPNNYLFTRTRDNALQDAVDNGAHPGDTVNRDHFTAQITSYEDLAQQYPDYDLSGLLKQNSEYAVVFSANREEAFSIGKTHAFLKLILPEGNNQFRVINIGYFADNDLATAAQIFAYLGKTERGALHGDEGHYMAHRDRLGMVTVVDNAEFTKLCNYLQKVFNKTRQDRLSFQPFGRNCASRLTKILRNTLADSFQTSLTSKLEAAYAERLKPVTIFDRLWKFFSKYCLFTTDAHRKANFHKGLQKAIDFDDMLTINTYLTELLPHIDETNAKELFEDTAKFLADIHLKNQKKINKVDEVKNAAGSKKYEALLEAVIDDNSQIGLAPYKQLTDTHNAAFLATIDKNLKNYEALVGKQISKDALNKELKNLLKEFVIQGLKSASPYGMSICDADHGPLNFIFTGLKAVSSESLRNFLFACVCFVLIAPMRWRNIQKYNKDGTPTDKTKSKSFMSDLLRANRFKLPDQMFRTLRDNDKNVVTEAVLCKKMQILQAKITSLETVTV